jgi:hypothetical protein
MDKPRLQYALFCREVIDEQEPTFAHVIKELWVDKPQALLLTLVLGLSEVWPGTHTVDINCLIPMSPTPEVQKWCITIPTKERCLNWQLAESLSLDIKAPGTYVFTILFNTDPLVRIWLPIHITNPQ